MLGAAQANAFSAKLASSLRVGRRVGVSTDLEGAIFIGPFHNRAKIARELRLLRANGTDHDFAGGTIDGEHIVVRERSTIHGDLAPLFIDMNFAAARHAATSPTACDHRRMTGHAARAGENPSGAVHAIDIFGIGFLANQQHLFASRSALHRFLGRER